ncbi:hypothetical protein GCM10023204_35530 [Actinomycetospora succinea]
MITSSSGAGKPSATVSATSPTGASTPAATSGAPACGSLDRPRSRSRRATGVRGQGLATETQAWKATADAIAAAPATWEAGAGVPPAASSSSTGERIAIPTTSCTSVIAALATSHQWCTSPQDVVHASTSPVVVEALAATASRNTSRWRAAPTAAPARAGSVRERPSRIASAAAPLIHAVELTTCSHTRSRRQCLVVTPTSVAITRSRDIGDDPGTPSARRTSMGVRI